MAGFFLLKVSGDIFDEKEKLRVFSPEEWEEEWISLENRDSEEPGPEDDIPF
jgi:hypothetical protein